MAASGSLGTLSIDVLANIANMVSDLGRATNENAKASAEFRKQWQESIDGVTESFNKLAEFAGAGLGVEALKEVAKQSLETAEQVEHMSQSFGLSTQNIQAMSFAAGVTGGSLETVSASFARLERSAQQAHAGNAQQLNDFQELGISSTQLTELLKHPDQLINTVTEHLAKFADGTGKTTVAIELMGRGAAQIIPFINEFGGNIEEATAKAKEFGVLLNDQDQGVLAKTQESLNLSAEAAKGMGNEFTLALAPAIRMVSQEFITFATSDGVKTFFKDMRDDIAQFLLVAKDVSSTVGGWTATFDGVLGPLDIMVADLHTATNAIGQFFEWFARVSGASLATTTNIKNDVAGWAEWIKDKTVIIAADVEILFIDIQKWSVVAWTAAENAVINFVKTTVVNLGTLADYTNIFAKMGWSFEDGAKHLVDGLHTVTASTDEYDVKIRTISKAVNESIIANEDDATALRQKADALKNVGAATDDATKKQLDHNAAAAAAQKVQQELEKELQQYQQQMDALAGKAGSEWNKIWDDYAATVAKLDDEIVKMQEHNLSAAAAQQMETDAERAAYEVALRKLELDKQKNDAADKYIQKLQDELGKLGLLTDAQKAAAEFDAIAAKNIISLHDAYGNLLPDMDAVIAANALEKQSFIDDASAIQHHIDLVKLNQQQLKEWQTIATNAFDQAFSAINKDIIEGGSVMKDLVNVAKSVVEAILLQFEKLAIINPLLNQIFSLSGTSGELPTSSIGSIMNNIGGLFGGGGSGGGGFGNLLNNWFGGGGAGAGAATSAGSLGDFTGPGTQFLNYGGSVNVTEGATAGVDQGFSAAANYGGASGPGFFGSAGSYGGALGIAGGVMAGLGEFNAAGGGLAGVAGGAAYGVGTAAIAGAVGTALSSGVAAGLAAIPVVGWIAIAAMALNAITGGGLFGTAAKPIGGNFTEAYGPGGGTVTDEMTYSGKKPLFGGRYFDEKTIADPQGQAAANSFFAALSAGQQAFADSLNDKMKQVITGGSWTEKTDKTGKPVAGSEVTKIGGDTFTGETEQQFQERLQSQAYLEVLDQMGLGATKFVSGFKSNADAYFKAVQDFASATQTANANLANGFKFMALSSDQTLVDVMNFVEGLQKAGETVSQTEARLVQAQNAYNQFVAQFKPQAVYVDPFEASLAKLNDTFKADVAQANALAIAAGAAGANAQDLANIQMNYSVSVAQLTAQLEDSAQQLAFSLGLTTVGSLSQVNAEITSLQQKANATTTSVSNFGNAITTVAQKTDAALQLMLGNLSPLNDQQKLQIALQGLRAGTVTADQVLTIGRSLYASSQAYNDLFNEVLPYANAPKGGGWTGGGSSSTTTKAGLSKEDQDRLDALLKEQAQMQNAATLQQYQTLAQEIAEIAAAKSESFAQVMADMKIDTTKLEGALGIKNDADLNKYLDQLQKQRDSNNQNTLSITSAIATTNGILNKIADAITDQNKIANKNEVSGTSQPGVKLQGQEMAKAFVDGVLPMLLGLGGQHTAQLPRSGRLPAIPIYNR